MDDAPETTPRRTLAWLTTCLALPAAAAMASLPFFATRIGIGPEEPMQFIGRFHVLLLHLPIGVMALVLLTELGRIFVRPAHPPAREALFPTVLLAVCAVLAVATGFLLYRTGGFTGNNLAARHLLGGSVFAALCCLALVARAWTTRPGSNPAIFRTLLLAACGVMLFASHDGGSLTHGPDYLTEYAPASWRRVLGLKSEQDAPAASDKALVDRAVYADIVAPVLANRCTACHKEGKARGGVRLDSYQALVKDAIVTPGAAATSRLVKAVELPMDDEYHMPPPAKPQVTPQELAVIKWWIDHGADGAKTVAAMAPPPEIQTALESLAAVPAAPPPAASAKAYVADPESTKALAGLNAAFPGTLAADSPADGTLSFTAASLRGKLDDDMLAKFAPLFPRLVTADLSATRVGDKGVATLTAADGLRALKLSETRITDAALDQVPRFTRLESLALAGTSVTDAGVAKLAQAPGLRKLYLWNTAVTPAAIAALREKLPKCEIIAAGP